MDKLKAMVAALVLGCSIYAHDSKAVMVIFNGTSQVEWRIGEPVQSINPFTDYFTLVACGAELAWVYENFSAIPGRAVGATSIAQKRIGTAEAPGETQCVFWHGDFARFIAENLDTGTNW
jgi:hypothetical protein